VSGTIDQTLNEALAQELYAALRERRTVPPLIARYPALTIDDAYAISLGALERRKADGERVIGKKIGVTSRLCRICSGSISPISGS